VIQCLCLISKFLEVVRADLPQTRRDEIHGIDTEFFSIFTVFFSKSAGFFSKLYFIPDFFPETPDFSREFLEKNPAKMEKKSVLL
jgi:hypothetical protein